MSKFNKWILVSGRNPHYEYCTPILSNNESDGKKYYWGWYLNGFRTTG
jgi:hypothetical protein